MLTSDDGSWVVFRTADDLFGTAKADNGKVIIKPEYGFISIDGNFAVATLSDAEYENIVKKMLKSAGIDENTSSREAAEKFEKIKPHEFVKLGNSAQAYKRLFNADGKMLKDYAYQPTVLWSKASGDTLVWKTSKNNDPSRDAYQLVSVSGLTTDVEAAGYANDTFNYTIDGVMYVKRPGKEPVSLSGSSLSTAGELFISHDKGETLSYLNIFDPEGNKLDFDGWCPVRWKSGPDGEGIFVRLLKGSPDDRIHPSGREADICYITPDGVISPTLPEGYSVRKDDYYHNVADLILPDGTRDALIWWHD